MQLGPAEVVDMADGAKGISVHVPPTRSDVLHAVDVVEDVAIAYGFNRRVSTLMSLYCTVALCSSSNTTILYFCR